MKGTRQLPQSFEKENLPSVPTAYNVYVGWPALSPDHEHPRIPLSHWVINRHRWKIFSFVTACTIASAIVSSFLTPIFESTATIDIARHMPVGIFRQESAQ